MLGWVLNTPLQKVIQYASLFFGVSEPGASVVLWLKLFYRRIIIITSHYAIGYK